MDIYFHQQSSSQVQNELKIVNASIIASLWCHQLLIFLPQIQDLKLFLHKGVISESPDMSAVLHVLSQCHMHNTACVMSRMILIKWLVNIKTDFLITNTIRKQNTF